MTTPIEAELPLSLAEASLTPRGRVHPSPATWRDQVLYFLLPDRFSDGKEGDRPLYSPDKAGTTAEGITVKGKAVEDKDWAASGKLFQGGTLDGIRSKLDYLQDLGITTLWIGPIWRQRSDSETYHGYGIQNFLDVDPRFGTRQHLRNLVDAAHDRGMYVLLDIIYNHSGNNFFYDQNGKAVEEEPYRHWPPYPVHGWRSKDGDSISLSQPLQNIDDGVWPREFQTLENYTRAGKIVNWDVATWEDFMHADVEFRRGDFFELKDINLTQPETLSALIQVYQYWIALSDCDGFRIDTVKHLPWEASRDFCGAVSEFAESIGKENFLLLGEVTGGAQIARNYIEIFGRNIDAVLDIGEPTLRLASFLKGQIPARDFFEQFGGHDELGNHRQLGRYHVSILDDHDMVGRPQKYRFAANNPIDTLAQQTAHAVGVMLTTLGIPCIYYGTEQGFDGSEAVGSPLTAPEDEYYEDRFVRESMFGGTAYPERVPFGAFRTSGYHFFDPNHDIYRHIAAIARVRNAQDSVGLALRRGRQYLRPIRTADASEFRDSMAGELAAWSRLLFQQEVLVVFNTHAVEAREAEIMVDPSLSPPGSQLTYQYRSDALDQPNLETVTVQGAKGVAFVSLQLPAAGMAILAA
ncbi:MAG: alpha-amylase family glycosyl hydrolase [Elainellaceae cyanobacterium]